MFSSWVRAHVTKSESSFQVESASEGTNTSIGLRPARELSTVGWVTVVSDAGVAGVCTVIGPTFRTGKIALPEFVTLPKPSHERSCARIPSPQNGENAQGERAGHRANFGLGAQIHRGAKDQCWSAESQNRSRNANPFTAGMKVRRNHFETITLDAHCGALRGPPSRHVAAWPKSPRVP